MTALIQLKQGSTQMWLESTTVLQRGEPGWDWDTDEVKIGDGVHLWPELSNIAQLGQILQLLADTREARDEAAQAAQDADADRTAAGQSQQQAQDARDLALTYRDQAQAATFGGTTVVAGLDLNTLTSPGVYRFGSAVAAASTNIPVPRAGILEVFFINGTGTPVQRFTEYGASQRGIYIRWASASWGAWRFLSTQRIDNPVDQPGVGVLTYDDMNSREQALLPVGMSTGLFDLNVITLPGIYHIQSTANATLARNYPKAGQAGVLHVANAGTYVTQQFHPSVAGSATARGFYIRRMLVSAGTWTSWEYVSSQRINNPADQPGIELSTYDDTANVDRKLQVIDMTLGGSNPADLNAVTIPGVYYAGSTIVTLERNYPVAGVGGVLEVLPTYTLQRFTPHNGGSSAAKGFWLRRYNSGAWDAWRFISTQRVDKSAGLAIYSWDDVGNRDQLMYGDTGWREIPLTNEWTGSIRARRVGYTVEVVGIGLTAGSATAVAALGTGFRPQQNIPLMGRPAVSTSPPVYGTISSASGTVGLPTGSPLHGSSFQLSYTTVDAWPSAPLVGAASGAIPNV